MTKLNLIFLSKTKKYIDSLSEAEQGKIAVSIRFMEDGNLEIVTTKQLRKSIRELIVGNHRIVYFVEHKTIYFIDAFRKRSQKTPKNIIANTISIHKIIRSQIWVNEKKQKRKK